MADALDEAAALLAKAKPWFFADDNPDSLWLVTGKYPGDLGTFQDCWAMVVPSLATGGALLFKLVGPLLHDMPVFGPENIARGKEFRPEPVDGETGDSHG